VKLAETGMATVADVSWNGCEWKMQ